jgi:PAS domain S-box-containing protein
LSIDNWLYGIISLLAGASALLLVLQKGVAVETKLISVCITLSIGLITTYLSKRLHRERNAIHEALSDVSAVLLKTESVHRELDVVRTAAMLSNELKLMSERDRLTFEYGDRFVFKLDMEGKILGLNRYPECFIGYNRKALVGVPILSFMTQSSATSMQEAIERCRETQQAASIEIDMRTVDGNIVDMSCTIEWSQRANAFYCIAQDITERKTIERYRAEVTAMLGHDLRGPLSSLTLLLENAFNGVYGQMPDSLRSALDRAQQSTRAMVSLINRLLEADRLESGEPTVKRELFYCEDLINEAVEVLHELSNAGNVAIKCEIEEMSVYADYNHSFQILCNLLANGIKFSPPHSVIAIRCSNSDNCALIEVSDQGEGIPAELSDTLFERYKSKATGKEPMASSGLGLFIARKLAQLQGGQIGFKPNSDGNGTTFWFTIPKQTFHT